MQSSPTTVTDEAFGDSPEPVQSKRSRRTRRTNSQLAQHLYEFALQRLSREPVPAAAEIVIGQQDLADLLGISHSAVHAWIASGKIVPARKNVATGGAMFRLRDVLTIACNAIRAGFARDLLQVPRHGFKPKVKTEVQLRSSPEAQTPDLFGNLS